MELYSMHELKREYGKDGYTKEYGLFCNDKNVLALAIDNAKDKIGMRVSAVKVFGGNVGELNPLDYVSTLDLVNLYKNKEKIKYVGRDKWYNTLSITFKYFGSFSIAVTSNSEASIDKFLGIMDNRLSLLESSLRGY